MQQIISSYIKSLETGNASPQTIRSYKKDLNKVCDYFGITSVEELVSITSAQYREFIEKKFEGLKPDTINGFIRNFNAFISWMKDSGIADVTEFSKVRFGRRGQMVKNPAKLRPVLTEDEVEAIVKAGNGIQEKFMLALALGTGLRRSEIASIKMSDISGCEIRITGKGNKQDVTYMNETLCQMLALYMTERNTDSEYLFYSRRGKSSKDGKISGVSINNRVKACALRSGMSKEKAEMITAHRLRATTITNVGITHGILAAQAIGRHVSSETTKRYLNMGNRLVKNILLGGE